MDIVSKKKKKKMTITIVTNVMSTASINCHHKKVRDCYILHIVFLAIILLLVITIICYYYAKQKGISLGISLKSRITCTFSHYFAKTKVDSYDSLPIEKILTLHNVIILIKSVSNKDKNNYYYKIFLENVRIN